MSDTFSSAVENKVAGQPAFLQEGLDLIKTFEGFRPKAYYDLDDKKKKGKLTVGYGFTNFDIPELNPNFVMDRKRAEQMLPDLIERKYGSAVKEMVTVPMNDEQFSALTSLAYNIGPTNLKNSTLLKRLNAGDYEGARGEFGKWVYAGGKPLEGLRRRREAEAALFGGDTKTLTEIIENQKFGPSITSPAPDLLPTEPRPKEEPPKVSVMDQMMDVTKGLTSVGEAMLTAPDAGGFTVPEIGKMGVPSYQNPASPTQTPVDISKVASQVPEFDVSFLSAVESGLNKRGGLRRA